ncbi:MAG TPA: AtpZ/AtpI family protein [Bacteroidales bacterium]|nr:AtpZ/AtpI family protein [Bacteroidales bacterium]HPT20909.1 AtpZ/AtpI family protein [Bacteroidales bacterium]
MEEQKTQKKRNRKNQANKGLNDFARYSGIAFQMVAIILITTWGGKELDKLAGFEKPVFLIILSLLGVFAAIYTVVKDFIK